MDTASVPSAYDDGSRRDTSVSMDDPDVRLAAEALSGLGNPGEPIAFITSSTRLIHHDRLCPLTNSTILYTLCS